ncbi:hypothetical protein [Ferrovibrio xuzhouensis]|uniref:Phage shock protein B n=1 Tax=Ferrovibrio xuzhouensis TaxID=1576914 RepID=A0ABV7VAV3_9PROT
MTDFLAILGFWLIGIPGIVLVGLMARSAERRRSLAYEWNTGELTRRKKRMETMEVETREYHRKIAELMLDIARLEARVGKLNDIVNERGSIKKTATRPAA